MDQLIEEIPQDIFNINFIKDLVVGQSRGRTNGARLFALIMFNLSSLNKVD
jgi:hypothetical protein